MALEDLHELTELQDAVAGALTRAAEELSRSSEQLELGRRRIDQVVASARGSTAGPQDPANTRFSS